MIDVKSTYNKKQMFISNIAYIINCKHNRNYKFKAVHNLYVESV